MFFLLFNVAMALELWTIPELTCTRCENDIKEFMPKIKGAKLISTSLTKKQMCFEGNPVEVEAKLAEKGYAIAKKKTVERCPKTKKTPWGNATGDVEIISQGEKIKFKDHLKKDKYTIFDFGASWCGPCFRIAAQLQKEMNQNKNIAVRAIELNAPPESAFDLPVAKQHLSFAPGLPWLVLYSPKGKKIYEGAIVSDLIDKIKDQ